MHIVRCTMKANIVIQSNIKQEQNAKYSNEVEKVLADLRDRT